MDGPRILLAGEPVFFLEDQPSLLALHNATFIRTNDGKEALELIRKHHPRLGIVVSVLRELSGAKLVKAVRQDPELRGMSLILLDATGESVRKGTAANIGLDCSVQFDREALVMLADRLLNISPRKKTRAAICLGRGEDEAATATYAQSEDVSETGMRVTCLEELEIGEDVSLHFVLPDRPELIVTRARVVRAEERDGERAYGLEYVGLAASDLLKIRSWLQEVEKAGGAPDPND